MLRSTEAGGPSPYPERLLKNYELVQRTTGVYKLERVQGLDKD
jgi:hypothetical protein